jgi:hypothetical protein
VARAETAALVASLTLDDKGFSKGISSAQKKLGELESTSFRVGQRIGGGLQSLGKNLAVLGVVGVGALTVAVKSGLDDLATLENAVTSVDGAIEQLGLTGQLTGKQVAGWANDIEADIDAAFDDKAITQAATTLLRFGHVAPNALEPALRVVADLAAKTGDVESASALLAKALADPTKAAGKLTRAGVVLTKQQQAQIKAMTEAGDVAGAQALLLDAVAKSTGGAAKAMAGPYQDAINKTNDAMEDARKALAVGFLPIITKVADKLSKLAADPKALASIEAFGKTLAGGLDKLISTAERLPWDAIGTSLQIAGMGAKAVLDAFVALPPWVQTAVLTGWGLNKLTGGALSGIVGELGKGLIKGVLGMNAGVVSIKAASVTVAGGVPGGGVTPVGGGGAGRLASLGSLIMKVTIVGMAAEVAELIKGPVVQTGIDIHDALGFLPTIKPDDLPWPFGPKNTPTILPGFLTPNGILGGTAPIPQPPDTNTGKGGKGNEGPTVRVPENPRLIEKMGVVATRQNISNERLESIRGYTAAQSVTASNLLRSNERQEATANAHHASGQAAAFAIRDKVASSGSLVTGAVNAVKTVAAATTSATQTVASRQNIANERLEAIRRKDFSPTVNISAKFSIQELSKGQKTFTKTFHSTVS